MHATASDASSKRKKRDPVIFLTEGTAELRPATNPPLVIRSFVIHNGQAQ